MKKETKITLIVVGVLVAVLAASIGFVVYDCSYAEYTKVEGHYAFSDGSGTIYVALHPVNRFIDGFDGSCWLLSSDNKELERCLFYIKYAGNGEYYSTDVFFEKGLPNGSLKLYDNGNKLKFQYGDVTDTLTRVDKNYTSSKSSATAQPTKTYTYVPTPTPSTPQLSLSLLEVMVGADAESKALERTPYNPIAHVGERTYLVKIRLTNTTSKPISVYPILYLKMYVDGVGYGCPSSLIILDKYPLPDSASIGYGESVTGWMYYIVPDTETPMLAYIDGTTKSNYVTIN